MTAAHPCSVACGSAMRSAVDVTEDPCGRSRPSTVVPDLLKGMQLACAAAFTVLLLLPSAAVSARLASCLQDLGQPGCQHVLHNDHGGILSQHTAAHTSCCWALSSHCPDLSCTRVTPGSWKACWTAGLFATRLVERSCARHFILAGLAIGQKEGLMGGTQSCVLLKRVKMPGQSLDH